MATYTAVDPEGTAVKWSLLVLVEEDLVDDAGDFSIDGGVLSLQGVAQLRGRDGRRLGRLTNVSNTYLVTVEATDSNQERRRMEDCDRHRHQRGRAGDGEADDVERRGLGSC